MSLFLWTVSFHLRFFCESEIFDQIKLCQGLKDTVVNQALLSLPWRITLNNVYSPFNKNMKAVWHLEIIKVNINTTHSLTIHWIIFKYLYYFTRNNSQEIIHVDFIKKYKVYMVLSQWPFPLGNFQSNNSSPICNF